MVGICLIEKLRYVKTSENKIIYEKNLLNTENKNLKENSDIKIFDLTSKLNEALASRENLLNFHHEEKNNLLLKNKQLENLNQDFEKSSLEWCFGIRQYLMRTVF